MSHISKKTGYSQINLRVGFEVKVASSLYILSINLLDTPLKGEEKSLFPKPYICKLGAQEERPQKQ